MWHRRAAGRVLAKGSLLRPHQVEVAAVLEEGASPHSVLTVKLWLAVLDSQLESALKSAPLPSHHLTTSWLLLPAFPSSQTWTV